MITNNPWRRFQQLIPESKRFIATVSQHIGSDRSKVQLRDGSFTVVVGQQGAVAEKVWVEDGKIVETAPDLPYTEIDV